jgi:hypothetical protein
VFIVRVPACGLIGMVVVALLGGPLLPAQEPQLPPATRLTGTVFDSTAHQPLAGALVQLLPAEDRTVARTVTSDSLGRFAFPDVAAGTWMLGFLHPRTDTIPGGAPTHLLTLRVGVDAREVTLFVPTDQRGEAELLAYRDPVGRVRGTVQDSVGRPVPSARVLDADERELARTTEAGTFMLEALPAGNQRLEVRAVGFAPQRFAFDVRPDETVLLDVELYGLAPVMATVTATARRTIAGFHERRGQGRGQYLDAEEIAKRRPLQVADAVWRLQGVIVTPRTSFSSRVFVRSGRRQCEPAVYIDGVELPSKTADLDAFVDVDDIAALEVYSTAAEVPLEFPGDPLCGAILIWRKEDHRRR